MLKLHRIKGGLSWNVLLEGKRLCSFPTRKEAKTFITDMQNKYGAIL